MAKRKESVSQEYEVTLNGSQQSWTTVATSPEEACEKVKKETESLRDVRNFSARVKGTAPSPPEVPANV